MNNGSVTGPSAAGQWLTFNNNVSGAGSYGGNVRFAGNLAPGNNGFAALSLNSFDLDDTTTFLLEIAGVTPGTQYDRLNFTGSGTLDGQLNVVLTGGFQPVEGNSFTILSGGTLAGAFDALNLPGLPVGLGWNYVQSASSAMLVVVPEPSPALAAFAALSLLLAVRRR